MTTAPVPVRDAETGSMRYVTRAESWAGFARYLAHGCAGAVIAYLVNLGYLATLAAGSLAALALGIPLREMAARLDEDVWPADRSTP